MRRPTKKSSRHSKKVCRYGRAGGRSPRPTVEGFGLRRGTLRADQLAQEALLPEGVPSALHREALLRVDLPLRRGGAHHGGERLPVPAWDGRRMPADIPRRALEGLPRKPPAGSARWRPQPPLREDRPSGEREPPRAPGLLPGAGPGGEVVPGVQTRVVQQDLRERRPNARGAHPDACTLLERPRAPQTAHRIPLVGGGGGGVVTSIARNGITPRCRGVGSFFAGKPSVGQPTSTFCVCRLGMEGVSVDFWCGFLADPMYPEREKNRWARGSLTSRERSAGWILRPRTRRARRPFTVICLAGSSGTMRSLAASTRCATATWWARSTSRRSSPRTGTTMSPSPAPMRPPQGRSDWAPGYSRSPSTWASSAAWPCSPTPPARCSASGSRGRTLARDGSTTLAVWAGTSSRPATPRRRAISTAGSSVGRSNRSRTVEESSTPRSRTPATRTAASCRWRSSTATRLPSGSLTSRSPRATPPWIRRAGLEVPCRPGP